ncbi:DNA-processing protein DprA [Vulcaniibacterium gelatinicum]|uniref:DNA-processing protein DprA n=1 Tax=Vulcaniibacterium gelatinicum TaxID=2598725 RepID=UPI0011CA096C|nr:DNA-processing protein DprA [Vulcaniibacterium gelatinicum]
MRPDDTDALLRLVLCAGPLAPRRALLEGRTPAQALAGGPPLWRAAGLDPIQQQALQAPDRAALARARAWLEAAPGRHLLGWHDPDYPALLRRGPSPPLALFVAGDPARLWHPAVAVVGSRAASAGGRENAARFAAAFVRQGLAVGSGLAAGIDTAAHLGALEAGGLTVAVLGTGVDVPYPRSNRGLYARIAETGAVVSEHPPGTPARRAQFPSRNRILAGLSLGTLVVEAALRSGALITARQAAEAGREVFALPGSIHHPLARGCHVLLREGAALVEDPEEVAAVLAPLAASLAEALRARLAAAPPAPPGPAAPAPPDTPLHQRLWKHLGPDPICMDQLVARTGLTPAELSSMLLLMELEGRVVVEHGRYTRKAS